MALDGYPRVSQRNGEVMLSAVVRVGTAGSSPTRRTVLAAAAGLTLAAAGITLSSPIAPAGWTTRALQSFGVLCIVAGLVVAIRSTVPTIGWLMICGGGLYHLGDLRVSEHPWLFATGFCLAYLWTALLSHIALALPTGRVTGPFSRALVVACYLGAVVTQVGRFVAERPGPPLWWNIRPPSTSFWAVAGSLTYAGLTLAVLTVIAHRWLTATRLRRRPSGPIWAALVVVGAAGLTVSVAAVLDAPPQVHVGALLATLAVDLLIIPLVVIVRRIRSALAESSATRVLLDMERRDQELRHPAQLGRALAEAVGDPALSVAYPLADGSFPDADGAAPEVDGAASDADGTGSGAHRPPPGAARTRVAAGPRRSTRVVTPVLRRGAVIARITHDEALSEQDEMTRTAFGLAGLAVENASLYRAQQAQIQELRDSRLRVSTAGFDERRRIQRDLHDGAQQQLYAVLMLLDTIRESLAPVAETEIDRIRATAGRAHLLLRDAIVEFQQLTQGIYPSALVADGLAGSLAQLAEIAPIPVEIRITPGRWPAHIEVTAYFFIAEGVANAYKHAGAEQLTVLVRQDAGRLHVEVADDGQGGAAARSGSGLSGLRDRIAAAGGAMTIDSPAGGGTRLVATLPLNEPCTPELEQPCG